jgi:hypothetical protein
MSLPRSRDCGPELFFAKVRVAGSNPVAPLD